MAMAMRKVEPFTLRNKLRDLCTYGDDGEDGSSYAIFWSFHPQNPFLLTVEDAYYEAPLGQEIANMLPLAYLFGEGIIGKAAFTGKHIWVHSDGQNQDNSGLHQQFSYGIKILERVEFLEQTQRLLMEMNNVDMIDMSGNAVSPLVCEDYDLNSLLASFSSENSEDLMRKVYSSESVNNPFPSLYNVYSEGVPSFRGDPCVGDQLSATKEAQVALCDTDFTGFGAWNGEVSFFDSFAQQLVSADENLFSCSELAVQDSALSSMYSMNIGACQDKLFNLLDNQHSSQSGVVTQVNFPASSNTLHGLSKNIEAVDMSEDFLNFSSLDEFCQWFAPSPDDNNFRAITALDNTPSEPIEFNPTSFGPVGSSSLSNIPMSCSAGANSIETSVVMHGSENSFFDFNTDQGDEWWENMPTMALSPTTFSECISELNTSTLTSTHNRLLFSETLSGEPSCNPLNSSNFEHEFSQRQAIEFAPMNINPIQFGNHARPAEATSDLMGSISYLEKTNNLVRKKDTFSELQVLSWIDDDHSINLGKVVPAHHQTQKPEEGTTKRTKKRTRPKESARPRPKDRQQIQDCIKELRGIIPNGEKYSIDVLLEETHKYMGYLQSITKYADKLREPIEQKLIDQAKEVALEDSNVEHPIIVEDMNTPGLMRIEFLCEDKGHFLEIAETIRDIRLNILIATMEPRKNKLWGYFIVEENQILECNNIVQQANRHLTSKDVFYFLLNLLPQTFASGMDSANNIANDIDLTDSWLRQSPEKTVMPQVMANSRLQ